MAPRKSLLRLSTTIAATIAAFSMATATSVAATSGESLASASGAKVAISDNQALGSHRALAKKERAKTPAQTESTDADTLFSAKRISDFWINHSAPGAITEVPDPAGSGADGAEDDGRRQRRAAVLGQPAGRAALALDDHRRGRILASDEVLPVPTDFPSRAGLDVPGLASTGAPFDGPSPWHLEVNGRQAAAGSATAPTATTSPGRCRWRKARWVSVMVHERFGADGWVEMWINGQPITFFGSDTYNPNHVAPTQRAGDGDDGLLQQRRPQLGEDHAVPPTRECSNRATLYFGALRLGRTRSRSRSLSAPAAAASAVSFLATWPTFSRSSRTIAAKPVHRRRLRGAPRQPMKRLRGTPTVRQAVGQGGRAFACSAGSRRDQRHRAQRRWLDRLGRLLGVRRRRRWPSLLDRIDGQFALIRLDPEPRGDPHRDRPLGMKPLFVASTAGCTYVSTSALVLARHLAPRPTASASKRSSAAAFSSVARPQWEGIERLRPAEFRDISRAGRRSGVYWEPSIESAVGRPLAGRFRRSLHRPRDSAAIATRYRGDPSLARPDRRLRQPPARPPNPPRRGRVHDQHGRRAEDEDVRLARRIAATGGWPWTRLDLPRTGWTSCRGLTGEALAWGDGHLEVLSLAGVMLRPSGEERARDDAAERGRRRGVPGSPVGTRAARRRAIEPASLLPVDRLAPAVAGRPLGAPHRSDRRRHDRVPGASSNNAPSPSRPFRTPSRTTSSTPSR